MTISLRGTVCTHDNVPLENASVYLVAPAELLHGVRSAAVHRPLSAISAIRSSMGSWHSVRLSVSAAQ